ncbi:MAG TPA: SDR family oxidoreductase [Mycobacteriales bacterium]|nr:SDR family oxidoreductase [Mycobacteriales bacterium]
MPPKVVLVTGVSRSLGGRLAARLAADPDVERVIGVDTAPPDREVAGMLGRTEFVRADIRNPLIAKVIATAAVDTVVHMSITSTPGAVAGRVPTKEMNVIGTMQLLAACQKSAAVRRLVVKSSTAVYGASPRDPALFTEDTEPRVPLPAGWAKDAVEIEGYVRGFGRRRPDVALTVLRFSNIIGPHVDSPLTRYLSRPVVPTVLGYDPRVQLLHEDDALEILRLAATEDRPGTYNVAGDGILTLSQAIRRAGRLMLPVVKPAMNLLAGLTRRSKLVTYPPENVRYLHYGRVVDNTRLKNEFGYTPKYTTAEAFDDFVQSSGLRAVVDPALVGRIERTLAGLVGRPRPGGHPDGTAGDRASR